MESLFAAEGKRFVASKQNRELPSVRIRLHLDTNKHQRNERMFHLRREERSQFNILSGANSNKSNAATRLKRECNLLPKDGRRKASRVIGFARTLLQTLGFGLELELKIEIGIGLGIKFMEQSREWEEILKLKLQLEHLFLFALVSKFSFRKEK